MPTRMYVEGLEVTMWEQSFKVEGMAKTVFVGKHMTQQAVIALVQAVMEHVKEKAEQQVAQKIADKVKAFLQKEQS